MPKTLPALLRAYEISARAAAVGFDWTRAEDVLDKIEEEVAEVRHEVESGRPDICREPKRKWGICSSPSPTCRASWASSRRPRSAGPTRSSRDASTRSEQAFTARGRSLQDATLSEMEDEWQRLKASYHEDTKILRYFDEL